MGRHFLLRFGKYAGKRAVRSQAGNRHSKRPLEPQQSHGYGSRHYIGDQKQNMDSHILIGKECGLKEQSMILLEQTRTVDKEKELSGYIGAVKDSDKRLEVKRGIKATLGLPVKPRPGRNALILSLCPKCRSEFMSVPENLVRRADYLQSEKEVCDKCQVGYG